MSESVPNQENDKEPTKAPGEYHPILGARESTEYRNRAFQCDRTSSQDFEEALQWMKAHRDAVGLIVGILTLVAGVVVAVIYGLQLDEMRGQLDQATDTAQKQLRAYVGFESEVIEPPNSQPEMWKYGGTCMRLKNYGATPAHDVVLSGWVATIANGPPGTFAKLRPDFTYPDLWGEKEEIHEVSHVYLDPGRTNDSRNGFRDDVPIFNPDIMKDHTCYYYGHVDYTDIYGVTHIREFCYRYVPETKGLVVSEAHNGEHIKN